ncbi:MAG: class II glutamine amidotransferase [Hyphomicrobiales bacterium]|nr:class II glutamine amidotransferase [Hyphomicrobiales bacterium]
MEDLLLKPSNSLIDQSLECRQGVARTNGDGFGIGWYGARQEPGLYREVLPAWNDCNLRALAKQIKSPLFFAHVRASTGTGTARLNCHPFSCGKWLFMHNGKIGGYELCRRQLENRLCDELFQYRQGSTDSELFFLLLLQNGLEENPPAALEQTICQITKVAGACGSDESFQLTVCLSNGKDLYACRHGSSAVPPTLYWCVTDGNVLVASEPLDDVGGDTTTSWNEVQADEILTVTDRIYILPLFRGHEHAELQDQPDLAVKAS